MHVRVALFAGSAVCLLAAVHCTRTQKPPEVVMAPPGLMMDAGSDGGGEGGEGGAESAPEKPRPDPALVQKALDRSGMPTADDQAGHGLRFEVVEIGPNHDWALAVVNRGSEAMSVVFDPRLLTLEVEAPPDPKPKKWAKPPKPRVCRLPAELRPARADLAYVVELDPGHGMVEAFDPRLYCVPQQGSSPLVAGARVTATFGWPPVTKTVWSHGKRVEEVPPQSAPFVAALAPKVPETPDGGPAGDEAATDAGTDAAAAPAGEIVMSDTPPALPIGGIKELHGTPFELGGDYMPPPPPTGAGLAFEVTQGSDAASESQATVTVRLSNRGTVPQYVYFRRELVTFEVSSVDGAQLCDPGPDDRAPDRQGFTQLRPGGSVSVTSRLAEMCPAETFARPGLYLINAALDPDADGADYGLDAFVGHLGAEHAATVRIRTGKLPFPGTRSLQEVQVGSAPH